MPAVDVDIILRFLLDVLYCVAESLQIFITPTAKLSSLVSSIADSLQ